MGSILRFIRPARRPARRFVHRMPRLFFSPRIRRMAFRYAGFATLLAMIPFLLDLDHEAPSGTVSGSAPPTASPSLRDRISVYDGDTIRLGRERIRIVGLDTPEYGRNARCREEALAAERAKRELQRLLASGTVALHRQGTDRYDRTLARVTVDGRDVAPALIEKGLARPYYGGRRAGWCG